MESAQPSSGPSQVQRALAAILFTDAVGFSARMQRDEVATLNLLQRDFGIMRRLSAEHSGTVLKTTGDGLLVTFSSAVHAVACALAMQRQFAEEAKSGTTGTNPMQHRIGIHLGDILMQDEDVMGDGVNIASRLQSEAEPGGICISQMVYDVVKNKLEMSVVSLGALELKNITHAMPVYRVLLEAQALSLVGAEHAPNNPAKPAGKGGGGMNPRIRIAVVAVVVVIILLLTLRKGDATTPGPAAAAAAAAATSARQPVELKNSVENVPYKQTRAYPLTLPYEGSLSIEVSVTKGNELDVELVPADQVENAKSRKEHTFVPNFEARKTKSYRRSERVPAGSYFLVLTDPTPSILSALSSSSSDVSVRVKLDP